MRYDKPYSGLALGDDDWLMERGEGRSVMFTFFDLAAVLRTADDLARVRKIFPSKNFSTANAC